MTHGRQYLLAAITIAAITDDAIAIIRPTVMTSARFSDGSIKLQRPSDTKMMICIKTIHPLV